MGQNRDCRACGGSGGSYESHVEGGYPGSEWAEFVETCEQCHGSGVDTCECDRGPTTESGYCETCNAEHELHEELNADDAGISECARRAMARGEAADRELDARKDWR